MAQIIVTVSPQGETTVTTQGFAGSSCQQASALLEQALGLRTDEKLTSEFYASSSHHDRQQLNQ